LSTPSWLSAFAENYFGLQTQYTSSSQTQPKVCCWVVNVFNLSGFHRDLCTQMTKNKHLQLIRIFA